MRLESKKQLLRHGLVPGDFGLFDIAAWVNGGRRRTARIMAASGISGAWPWNRTCAIGGQVSLCDRPVRSWKEAEKFVGCSRQTILRTFGRGLKRLRFSDLEEMKIGRGAACEYFQVCNLKEMEERVEENRRRGTISFAYVAAENKVDNDLFTWAVIAALRSGVELKGFEDEIPCGKYTEPFGKVDPVKYIGPRRKPWGTDAGILQKQIIERRWADQVMWCANIDYLHLDGILDAPKEVLFGANTLTKAVRTSMKMEVPLAVFGGAKYKLTKVFGHYLTGFQRKKWEFI